MYNILFTKIICFYNCNEKFRSSYASSTNILYYKMFENKVMYTLYSMVFKYLYDFISPKIRGLAT